MTTSTLLPFTPIAPTAATPTLFYTVPTSTSSTVYQLVVINTDASVATDYTIWRIPSGGTPPVTEVDQLPNVFVYKQPINALERQSIGDRMSMAAGDTIYVWATLGTVSISGSVLQQA